MVLVDTSVWIDLFGRCPTLDVPVDRLPILATCSPIIQEILQGVSDQRAFSRIKAGMTSLHRFSDPLTMDTYLHAADIYRSGRRKGLTIRSSADCLIAAVALENNLTLWHKDRDFDVIGQFTDLRVVRQL